MCIIEVRKPKCFLKWIYGYSYRFEKWQRSLPNDGDFIILTWLPNPRNAPACKSIYIGCKGTVRDMDKTDGSFCLKMPNGGILVHTGRDFNYKILTK